MRGGKRRVPPELYNNTLWLKFQQFLNHQPSSFSAMAGPSCAIYRLGDGHGETFETNVCDQVFCRRTDCVIVDLVQESGETTLLDPRLMCRPCLLRYLIKKPCPIDLVTLPTVDGWDVLGRKGAKKWIIQDLLANEWWPADREIPKQEVGQRNHIWNGAKARKPKVIKHNMKAKVEMKQEVKDEI